MAPEHSGGLPPSLVGNTALTVNTGLKGLQILGNSIMPLVTYFAAPIAGRPVTHPQHPPTPGDVARFTAVAARYGYTMGTPEENAAVGIEMPKFAVSQ